MKIMLCFISAGCSMRPKHQKVLVGALIGSAVTAATAESQDNKSLYIASGAAVGALTAWTLVTLIDQEHAQMEKLTAEKQALQKKLELIDRVQRKDGSLQMKTIKEWKEVSREKNQQRLQFIENEYQDQSQ